MFFLWQGRVGPATRAIASDCQIVEEHAFCECLWPRNVANHGLTYGSSSFPYERTIGFGPICFWTSAAKACGSFSFIRLRKRKRRRKRDRERDRECVRNSPILRLKFQCWKRPSVRPKWWCPLSEIPGSRNSCLLMAHRFAGQIKRCRLC